MEICDGAPPVLWPLQATTCPLAGGGRAAIMLRLPVPDRQFSGTGAGFPAHNASIFELFTGHAGLSSTTLFALRQL